MNEDYLWDRSGEPDPEIQQLEQVLGRLRYQPRPLKLPAKVRVGHPRSFLPRLAIAAAVAAILAGGAIWLLLQRTSVDLESASHLPAIKKADVAPEKVVVAEPPPIAETRAFSETLPNEPRRRGVRKSLIERNQQFRHLRAGGTKLTPGDRAEGEAAKEQLLLALRLASGKLSLAQKRVQGGHPASLIRNQHRIG